MPSFGCVKRLVTHKDAKLAEDKPDKPRLVKRQDSLRLGRWMCGPLDHGVDFHVPHILDHSHTSQARHTDGKLGDAAKAILIGSTPGSVGGRLRLSRNEKFRFFFFFFPLLRVK